MELQGDWAKELEDEMSCAVCQDTIVAAHSLVPCGHCFCGTCLFQWLSRKQICPTCRSALAILAGLRLTLMNPGMLAVSKMSPGSPRISLGIVFWIALALLTHEILIVLLSCKASSSAKNAFLPLLPCPAMSKVGAWKAMCGCAGSPQRRLQSGAWSSTTSRPSLRAA